MRRAEQATPVGVLRFCLDVGSRHLEQLHSRGMPEVELEGQAAHRRARFHVLPCSLVGDQDGPGGGHGFGHGVSEILIEAGHEHKVGSSEVGPQF